ncbi:MAG: hypothetical protein IPI95_08390 [Flavobacteriales bacterium]|nr:hypothetical protein [Flavobacteriales bacterium]
MNDILCPTDLSETSLHGLRYADHLASRFASSISLLHVMGKKELTEEGRSNAKDRMEQQRSQITKSPTVVHFREGDFISEIADESRKGHSLMGAPPTVAGPAAITFYCGHPEACPPCGSPDLGGAGQKPGAEFLRSDRNARGGTSGH